jgi:hypothetical protein
VDIYDYYEERDIPRWVISITDSRAVCSCGDARPARTFFKLHEGFGPVATPYMCSYPDGTLSSESTADSWYFCNSTGGGVLDILDWHIVIRGDEGRDLVMARAVACSTVCAFESSWWCLIHAVARSMSIWIKRTGHLSSRVRAHMLIDDVKQAKWWREGGSCFKMVYCCRCI